MDRRGEPRGRRGIGRGALAALVALQGLLACSNDRPATESTPLSSAEAEAEAERPKVAVTADPAAAADVVIRQGRIFTGDPARPWVLAVAAKDGRIVAAGSNRDVKPLIGEKTRVIDLDLHFVMTGLVEPPGKPTPGAGSEPDLSPNDAWKEIEAAAVAAQAADQAAVAKAGEGAQLGPTAVAGKDRMAKLLRSWTIDNARAAGREDELGTLEVGKRADILVLDRHPFFSPPEHLGETRALVIVSGGKIVRNEIAARPRG